MVKKSVSSSKTSAPKKVVKKTSKKSTSKNLSSKKTKTTKTKTSKSKSKTTSIEVSSAPPVPPTTVPSTTTTKKSTPDEIFEATMNRIRENYDSIITEVDALAKANKSLLSRLKKNKKAAEREVQQLYKKTRTESKKRKPRKPSGFAKPCLVSDDLCEFLGKPKGTEMARTAVTTFITNYIKDNNLQNPKNKKEIICDKALKKIITLGPDDEPLTYFNIQKFMKHHYKTSSSVSAVSV